MLLCTQCGRALDEDEVGLPRLRCRGCGAELEVRSFPALGRSPAAGGRGEPLDDDSDAACFEHGDRKAVGHCSECGRFLCRLCEVELGGEAVCFECFAERAREGGGELDTEAVLWDSVALSLAIVPLLVWFVTVVTAPMTLYLVARHWKDPGGLVPRSRIRFVIAGVLALLQLGGWAALAVGLASGGLSG